MREIWDGHNGTRGVVMDCWSTSWNKRNLDCCYINLLQEYGIKCLM